VGRMGDANPIVELLTTQDAGRARVLATQIEAMNAKRRFITRQVEKAAESMLQSSSEDRHAPAIVLYHPGWPGGVVGVVAGHLAERYHKPAILLTGDENIHGSARSIEGINIIEAIASQTDLLHAFGGHPMAAGMSMQASAFPAFKRGLLSFIEEKSRLVEIKKEVELSDVLTLDEIELELVEQIQRLAPFGPGNPPLNFLIRNLSLISASSVGSQGEHRQVLAADEREEQRRFIWWNGSDEPLPEAQFDLVCRLSTTNYKGDPQVSAEWMDFRLSDKGIKAIESRHLQWIDYRDAISPASMLNTILKSHPDAQVWAEGQIPDGIPAENRLGLSDCEILVIWTAPPSLSVLQDVVQRTSPIQVFVLGLPPSSGGYEEFLSQIGGLVKYAIRHKNGLTALDSLAGACAADREAVRICLQLWEAKGRINVVFNGEDVQLRETDSTPDEKVIEILEELLQNILAEIQAFRRFFRTGDLESFISK
jgi:single-stranded-DNA-specific exonuclease